MSLFIISDQHFGHKNIIRYCGRPFADTIENARFMYEAYQDTVGEDDVVVFLGDIAMFTKRTAEPFKQMFRSFKGTKFLVRGNHDSKPASFYLECGFKSINDYHIVGDTMLCHYPLSNGDHPVLENILRNHCKRLYHGHTHERNVVKDDGIIRTNFSVEQINYTPKLVLRDDIEEYFRDLNNQTKRG